MFTVVEKAEKESRVTLALLMENCSSYVVVMVLIVIRQNVTMTTGLP